MSHEIPNSSSHQSVIQVGGTCLLSPVQCCSGTDFDRCVFLFEIIIYFVFVSLNLLPKYVVSVDLV